MITINKEIIPDLYWNFNDLRKRGISVDFLNLLNDIQTKSEEEVQQLAAFYGIHLTISEIIQLRPLLQEVSIHWYFTGIPSSFLLKIERILGKAKTKEFLAMYEAATNRSSR